ncbi:MAG: hypothetical protein ACRDCC_08385 [Culicoidibacterales bacterium]
MDTNFFALIIFLALISFIAINFKITLNYRQQRKVMLFDLEEERQNMIEYHLKKGDYEFAKMWSE